MQHEGLATHEQQRKEVQLNQASDLSEAIALAKMGQQSMVKCLHHDDGTGSVHVAPGTTHPVLITCHAGCTFEQILTAAGVDVQETLADRDPNDITAQNEWTPGGPASHIYTYADENGELLFEVLRAPQPGGGKKFFQRHRDSNERSGWKWSMQGVRRILYRLPEVCQAVSNGHTVYVVEGEKDVETVRGLGCYATTSPMGAGKWNDEYSQSLAGARVVIISDADTAGRNHARSVRESLIGAGCSVSICEPKEGCKDVTDHVRAGGTLETLIETVPETEDKRGSYGVDVLTAIKRVFEQKSFVIPQVLARGDRLLVTGFEGHGKALALDTLVAAPGGMVELGSLSVGDVIYAGNGNLTKITAKSEVFTDKDCYEVVFDDGSTVIAAGDHLWETETRKSREASARYRKRPELVLPHGTDQSHKRIHEPKNVTTEHIAATLLTESGGVNHSVRVAGKLQGHSNPLPVDPYTLGAWLGDGHSAGARITIHPDDEQIIDRIRSAGWTVTKMSGQYLWSITGEQKWIGSLSATLRNMGLLDNKHIPRQYLYADAESRLALIQGLMDTDGHVSKTGQSEFCSTSERLATGMSWLLRSMGIKVKHVDGRSVLNGVDHGPKYRLIFTTDEKVFHLARKADRITPRPTDRQKLRYITEVNPVPRVPVQCIQVEDECHTYLVTSALIPTHNSTLLRQMAVQCAAGVHPWTNLPMPPQKVLVIDVENHPDQTLESWQQLVGLVAHHGSPMQEGQLTILEEWDNDIDLCSEEGYAWMMERIHAYKPDILFMGPLYNMANKDLKDDETVRKLKRVVNDGRAICGTAFVMEHHAPHKGPGDKERSVRPYGSSTFLKWPDFGFGLRPTETEGVYEWQKTRFPRVRSRHFPAFVRWGKVNSAEFPWMEAMQDDAGNVY